MILRLRERELDLSEPVLMGIVNATPDSFSDRQGPKDADELADQARRLTEEGAAIVDVGGESGRTDTDAVPVEEEAARVVPVVERLSAEGVLVSVDTWRGHVARAALAAGAAMINDVSGLSDESVAAACAETGAALVITHTQAPPKTKVFPHYDDVAAEVREFLRERMREDDRWLRTYNRGRAKIPAYLEDHAFLLEASLTLYEATFEERWFTQARSLADEILERFADAENGGFFSTAADHEGLIARRKDIEDNPIPAGQSAACLALLRLAALTGEHRYEEAALGTIRLLHTIAPQHPAAFGHLLQAIDFHVSPVREVALVGPELGPLERVVRSTYRPRIVLAGGEPDGVPLLAGREPVDGRAAAYVCERFACRRPVTEPDELAALLD